MTVIVVVDHSWQKCGATICPKRLQWTVNLRNKLFIQLLTTYSCPYTKNKKNKTIHCGGLGFLWQVVLERFCWTKTTEKIDLVEGVSEDGALSSEWINKVAGSQQMGKDAQWNGNLSISEATWQAWRDFPTHLHTCGARSNVWRHNKCRQSESSPVVDYIWNGP